MKKLNLYLACALFVLSITSCNSESEKGWRLVWEEEFDQTEIDRTVWSKVTRGTSDWNNYMADHDILYDLQDGNLVLRGIVNDRFPEDSVPYLTGGLESMDKKTFSNGRLEIKAKLQGATGAWPAIWMVGQEGRWPKSGEIDIMERLNDEDIAYQTVHSYYTYTLGIQEPEKGSTGKINKNEYNVYTVEMYPDSLSFYINENHTFTYPRIDTDQEGQFPFDKPFYLILSMQLGGSWVGQVDPADLPVEMWIDWIRFYQK